MSKRTPDQIVLDQDFEAFYNNEYPGLDKDWAFEIYSAHQILKRFGLTSEEIEAGVVDGGDDGGLDSFYVFLDGSLVSPDDPRLVVDDDSIRTVAKNASLEVFAIQSKNQTSWKEEVWHNLLSSLDELLDADQTDADLEKQYRPEVVERTGILRRATKSLAPKFPTVAFRACYVTRAPEANLTASLGRKARQVETAVKKLLTKGSVVTAESIGADGLYQLAGVDYNKPASITFEKVMEFENDSYVGVATLREYLSFVRDEAGSLRDELFDSNVRDYEGDNSVNEAIRETLSTSDEVEFWWLNNGVTVLSEEVHSPKSTLTVAAPLIVNGLQTTHVLHTAEAAGAVPEERLNSGVVVRIVVSQDEEVRDRIIAGTNRQTQVPSPALYATQPHQRDIERFLVANGWFYERRKNQYKNLKKPAKQRISMNLLAQSMITLKLGQPNSARARPSTLLSPKSGYEQIFAPTTDPQVYLSAIRVIKGVDAFLASDKAKAILDEPTNARFYIAAGYVIKKLRIRKTENLRFVENAAKFGVELSQPLLIAALEELRDSAAEFSAARKKLSRDAIFKNSEFRDFYFARLTGTTAS